MDLIPVRNMQAYLDSLLVRVERYVLIESPSTEKAAVDELAAAFAADARGLGAEVELRPQQQVGDQVIARWPASGEGSALLLCHLDTVHPLGTLDHFGLEKGPRKWSGPGIFDMKTSIAMALTAVEALQREKNGLGRPLTLLCSTDEEIGSHYSQELIEELAQQHSLVLCLEPALADGALKTRRKGIGLFELEVSGRAAHAGVSPEDGANAIVAMSLIIQQLQALAKPELGLTLNVGTIEGGSRSNVVPERCQVELDVRLPTPDLADELEAALHALTTDDPGTELTVRGGWNRPPMPRTRAIAEAYQQAQAIASELGFELSEGGTGGGSDANFVAPLDVPLLDGLGPIGGGAHTNEEFIWLDSLPRRTALLAGLIRAFR